MPPLHEEEQRFTFDSRYREDIYRGSAVLLYDNQKRLLKKRPKRRDYRNHLAVPIGKTFFVEADNEPFFVIWCEVPMNADPQNWTTLYLPAGFEVPMEPGDRAVYIGTLIYYRNRFMDIEKVELVDDFRLAEIEFVERFGRGIKLKKALLRDTRKDTSGASGT